MAYNFNNSFSQYNQNRNGYSDPLNELITPRPPRVAGQQQQNPQPILHGGNGPANRSSGGNRGGPPAFNLGSLTRGRGQQQGGGDLQIPGYRLAGDGSYVRRTGGGHPQDGYSNILSAADAQRMAGPAGGGLLGQLGSALGQDMTRQQWGMDQAYQANVGQQGSFEEALGRNTQGLRDAGERARGEARGVSGQMDQAGRDSYNRFSEFRDQQMGEVDRDIDSANRFAAEATDSYRDTISNFRDTSAQDAANAAFGLRRTMQEQTSSIRAGLRPDGTMMSPAEQQAATSQLQMDVSNQVTTAVGQIFSNSNRLVAEMGANLSNLQMGQAQTAMAGGNLRGQVGTAFGGQTLQAEGIRQQYAELSGQYRMMGEQMSSAGLMAAAQMEMQGRGAMSDYVYRNPRQFVSMFAGLSSYLAAASIPGAGQFSQLNFPQG